MTYVVPSPSGAAVYDAISSAAYNLQAAAYSQTTNIVDDYILNRITFQFTARESRRITITRADGSVIYDRTNDKLEVSLTEIDEAIKGGQNITIAITQTSGACAVDVKLSVVRGAAALAGTAVSVTSMPTLELEGLEFFGGGATKRKAQVTSDGELATTVTERERNNFVRYKENGINSTRYCVLVDLSDTINFPHDQTGRIDVSCLSDQIDKPANAQGSIAVGVIAAINGTQATIFYASGIFFDNSSDTHLTRDRNFSPSQMKLGVSGGKLTRGITNDSETTTAVNTGVTLSSPRGSNTVTPAVGDVVIKFTHTAGSAWNAGIFALYHSEAAP